MMRWIRRSDCDRASGMLSEYLDGYLDPKDKAWLEGHLAGCSRCRDELDSLRGTVALLQGLPLAEPRRAFLIGPRPVPVPVPVRGWGALRLGTAVATVLLLAMITADMLGVMASRPPAAPAPAATPSGASTASASPPAAAQGDLRGPAGPTGPVGIAGLEGPPAPTALGGESKAAVPMGTPVPMLPAATGEDRAPLRAVPVREAKPAPAQEFQYADTLTAAGTGVPPTPVPVPRPTPSPPPTPADQLQAAGPAPQMAEELQYASGNATPAPLAHDTLLQTTWPLQVGLAAVWLVLVALTGYFWRVRSKGARSVRR